ncbi:helix-turn-helix domain-containing protein [Paenibacillus sp. GCM10027626]|uniref:helix-turn-helix domain-containing protein n=1 Tax=Paenibacillus sp. GCM10027626 TaxID=3273411 RepID=UPI00362D9FBE
MLFSRSRLFWKYFVSYIFVLIIPLVTIGAFVFNTFSGYIAAETIETNRNMLTQVKNMIDTRFKELENIAFQISANPDLTPYKLKESAYEKIRGVTALKNYMSTTGFIHDLFLYTRGDQFIYSPSSTYVVERFLESKYKYKHWSADDFQEVLQTAAMPTMRPTEDVVVMEMDNRAKAERLMTLIVPIPVHESTPYGTLLFQVKETVIRSFIDEVFGKYEGNSIVFDQDGNVITSLQPDDSIYTEQLQRFYAAGMAETSEPITINGEPFLFSSVQSDVVHWTYVTLIPTKELMKTVSEMRWKSMAGLLTVLLIGSGATFYFSIKHYNPIKQLKDFAENKWGKRAGNINEIEIVRQVIDSISDDNTNLANQVMSSRHALKDYLLFKLIKGQIYNMAEFNSLGKNVDLVFTKSSFMVAVFYLHMTEKILNFKHERMVSFLEEQLPGDVEGYAKESMDYNVVVLLLAMEPENKERVERQISNLKNNINDGWNFHVTVGIGSLYDDLSIVGKSYLEAMTALQYRFISGNNRVIRFADIDNKDFALSDYPTRELEQLGAAIKREDIEAIGEAIRAITHIIHHHQLSIFVARSLCYDVINTVIKTVVDMNDNYLSDDGEYPDVLTLMKFDTIEELEDAVLKLCERICAMIRSKRSNQSSLMQKLEQYLDQRYCDPAVSVRATAETVGVTASYLSRYFKEQTGMTLTEYINGKRMKAAEDLLKHSDESIQNIVYKIGYYDQSSFIRKFKSKNGITPGDFRKMYRP